MIASFPSAALQVSWFCVDCEKFSLSLYLHMLFNDQPLLSLTYIVYVLIIVKFITNYLLKHAFMHHESNF